MKTQQQKDRERIARETEEFLARGGKVTVLTSADSFFSQQPVKRPRREQIEFIRRFGANRRMG